jgi:protein SERAC1
MLVSASRSERDDDVNLLQMAYGVAFFGVPHGGMDIASLIPMVTDRPNRALIGSLNHINSQILTTLRRDFHNALGEKSGSEIVCFYETRESPTAQKVQHLI